MFDARREYMEQLKHYKTPKEWREMQAKIRARHRVCGECGTSFVAVHRERRIYCSSNCRIRAHRRQNRESYKRKEQARSDRAAQEDYLGGRT
jgi:ribosomal protein S27AE